MNKRAVYLLFGFLATLIGFTSIIFISMTSDWSSSSMQVGSVQGQVLRADAKFTLMEQQLMLIAHRSVLDYFSQDSSADSSARCLQQQGVGRVLQDLEGTYEPSERKILACISQDITTRMDRYVTAFNANRYSSNLPSTQSAVELRDTLDAKSLSQVFFEFGKQRGSSSSEDLELPELDYSIGIVDEDLRFESTEYAVFDIYFDNYGHREISQAVREKDAQYGGLYFDYVTFTVDLSTKQYEELFPFTVLGKQRDKAHICTRFALSDAQFSSDEKTFCQSYSGLEITHSKDSVYKFSSENYDYIINTGCLSSEDATPQQHTGFTTLVNGHKQIQTVTLSSPSNVIEFSGTNKLSMRYGPTGWQYQDQSEWKPLGELTTKDDFTTLQFIIQATYANTDHSLAQGLAVLHSVLQAQSQDRLNQVSIQGTAPILTSVDTLKNQVVSSDLASQIVQLEQSEQQRQALYTSMAALPHSDSTCFY